MKWTYASWSVCRRQFQMNGCEVWAIPKTKHPLRGDRNSLTTKYDILMRWLLIFIRIYMTASEWEVNYTANQISQSNLWYSIASNFLFHKNKIIHLSLQETCLILIECMNKDGIPGKCQASGCDFLFFSWLWMYELSTTTTILMVPSRRFNYSNKWWKYAISCQPTVRQMVRIERQTRSSHASASTSQYSRWTHIAHPNYFICRILTAN